MSRGWPGHRPISAGSLREAHSSFQEVASTNSVSLPSILDRGFANQTIARRFKQTYAFPSYPSAQGTACAGAMRAFAEVFGDDTAFVMHTDAVDIAGPFSEKIEMHPPTRSFQLFSDAASECGLSRVYLGLHFRYDFVEGVTLGTKVGDNIVHALLQPRDSQQ